MCSERGGQSRLFCSRAAGLFCLTHLKSTLAKTVSKQIGFISLGMNTYKNPGGGSGSVKESARPHSLSRGSQPHQEARCGDEAHQSCRRKMLRVTFLEETADRKFINTCLLEQLQYFLPGVASILAEVLA